MGAPFVERFFANVDPIEVSQLMSHLGQNATEPFGAGADQCLLFPASDQIAVRSRMTLRANKRHRSRMAAQLTGIVN
jgi:hypothetical protein